MRKWLILLVLAGLLLPACKRQAAQKSENYEFTFQVGSFIKQENALYVRDKLTKEGYDVVMEEGRVGDLPSYRIIIHYTGPLEFTYQAGAFVDEDNAKALQEELRAKGFDTSLDSAQVDSTTYFRVYVRYNQGAGLEQLLQKLKDMGLGEPLFRGVRPL